MSRFPSRTCSLALGPAATSVKGAARMGQLHRNGGLFPKLMSTAADEHMYCPSTGAAPAAGARPRAGCTLLSTHQLIRSSPRGARSQALRGLNAHVPRSPLGSKLVRVERGNLRHRRLADRLLAPRMPSAANPPQSALAILVRPHTPSSPSLRIRRFAPYTRHRRSKRCRRGRACTGRPEAERVCLRGNLERARPKC